MSGIGCGGREIGGVGLVCCDATLAKTVASFSSASLSFSGIGAGGLAGDGFWRM